MFLAVRFLLVLGFVAGPAVAGPPLGCVETSSGARWCIGWPAPVQVPVPVSVPGWVHPATQPRAARPYEGVGQVVQGLPVERVLPWRVPRFVAEREPAAQILPASSGVRPSGDRR